MKRFLLLIGLLLLPLNVVSATGPPSPPPLSPWVENVLERAEAVIKSGGYADSVAHPQSPCTPEVLEHVASKNVGVIKKWLSTTVHLAQESEFLRERTVCVQYDRSLLLEKIKEVMDTMTQATAVCDDSKSVVLQQTFEFLTRAYASFLRGSMDPTFSDDLLRYRYSFEKDQKEEVLPDPALANEPLCPFTTDYGPHSLAYLPPPTGALGTGNNYSGTRSYGCDVSVLQSLPASFNSETEPLVQFMQQSDSMAWSFYSSVRDALRDLNSLVSVLNGGSLSSGSSSSSGVGSPPNYPHRKADGCLRPLIPQENSRTYGDDIEALLAAYPGYFDPKNQDLTNGLSPAPALALPQGALFLPSFDFFTSTANPLILLRQFVNRKLQIGQSRPLPSSLFMQPSPDGSYAMNQFGLANDPATFQAIGANTEVSIGTIDAGNRDALERMEDVSLPLKTAVASLTDVVENDFPKTAVPDLTFFIARSCVDGPCQKTLETVLKRSLNPYCHPYLSGRYREDDSLKKCFCDPSIKGSWGEYDQYCSDTYKRAEYESRNPTLIPACQPGGEE